MQVKRRLCTLKQQHPNHTDNSYGSLWDCQVATAVATAKPVGSHDSWPFPVIACILLGDLYSSATCCPVPTQLSVTDLCLLQLLLLLSVLKAAERGVDIRDICSLMRLLLLRPLLLTLLPAVVAAHSRVPSGCFP